MLADVDAAVTALLYAHYCQLYDVCSLIMVIDADDKRHADVLRDVLIIAAQLMRLLGCRFYTLCRCRYAMPPDVARVYVCL